MCIYLKEGRCQSVKSSVYLAPHSTHAAYPREGFSSLGKQKIQKYLISKQIYVGHKVAQTGM